MSRSLSWIDPSSLASAVSRARAPASSVPAPAAAQASFIPTALPSAPTFPAREMAPLPPTEPYVPVAQPQVPEGESSAERSVAMCVRKLARWVEAELGPRRWYVADEEGLALHAAEVTDTQVLGAAMLARALKPLRSVIGKETVESVTLCLDGGRTLQTLWVDTDCGRVALGLEGPKRVDRAAMLAATQAVQAAFRVSTPDGGRRNS